jgi:hypothetical protein
MTNEFILTSIAHTMLDRTFALRPLVDEDDVPIVPHEHIHRTDWVLNAAKNEIVALDIHTQGGQVFRVLVTELKRWKA